VAKAKSRQVQRAQQRARAAHHTAADSERMNRTLIVGGIVAVILIVLGIIGFGWYQTQIRPLGKTVLTVGDVKFNLAHLERRMELELQDNPFYTSSNALLQLPDIMYERLVEEGRLLEAGPTLPSITLTEEDLTAEIRARSGLAEDVAPDVFAAEFRRQVEESGLRENEYRQMLQAEILRDKVRAFFIFAAPAEAEQARARWIVVDTQADADEALQRLAAGEDFVEVALDLSAQPQLAEPGETDEDWIPRELLGNEPLEKFLFDEAAPGQRSDIIVSNDVFYIVELLDHEEARALSDVQRSNVAELDMQEWLEGVDVKVDRNFSEEDAVRALDDAID
jgi:hypothetical protein